jgi:hypothetical protein
MTTKNECPAVQSQGNPIQCVAYRKGTKPHRINKHSDTRNLAFAQTADTQQPETTVIRALFEVNPNTAYSRADIAEYLNKPINHATRVIFDLLEIGFIEVSGREINPRSGKSVEVVRLAPPPVMVVKEQSLFDRVEAGHYEQ